jgi:glycosyltransferase involved in cell wall biosynthesis
VEQIPFEEMLAYLSIADIGITPLQPRDKNTYYSLARKFLEYIAAGIPVIVSDFPEYRALVDQYDLGLTVNPEDPQEIAATVNRLVEDPSLREQLGQNALKAFDIELNWEMESVKLLDLYDGLRKSDLVTG